MRILAQTRRELAVRSARQAPLVLVLGAALGLSSVAQAATGTIRCTVTENGAAAHGTVELEREGHETVGGACDEVITLAEGPWHATLRLAGVVDNPSREIDVTVKPGVSSSIRADFPTGTLQVRIQSARRGSTATVTLNRGAQRVGTLVDGVPARLSAGRYQVVVRYSGEEKRYAVELEPGQTRLIRAQF